MQGVIADPPGVGKPTGVGASPELDVGRLSRQSPVRMREIFQAASLHEAQLLVIRLEEQGIRTHVRNVDLQGALGELPMTLRPVVCVLSDADWADAVMVAGEFEEQQRREPGPPRTCGGCGEQSPDNFQVCWKCRAEFEVDRDADPNA